MNEDYNPFESEAAELAYIKEKGLDKYACSKHGLDVDPTCTECHDMLTKFLGDRNLYVTSEYGSTGRDGGRQN